MAPKNTYLSNIAFSTQILVLLISIFYDASAQIPVGKTSPNYSSTIKSVSLCPLTDKKILFAAIASDNLGKIYIASQEGIVESFFLPTGNKIWRAELGGEIKSQIILDKEGTKTVYLVTKSNSGFLRAIDLDTGITKWQISIPLSEYESEMEFFLNIYHKILIVSGRNGGILSLDKETGSIRWAKNIVSDFSSFSSKAAFFEDQTFLYGTDKNILIINSNDGSTIKQLRMPSIPNILLALNRNEFIWGDKIGKLYIGGKLKFRAGGEISNINITSHGILIASKDNFLYLLSTSSQNIIWKKKLPGRVFPKPFIINNYAFVSVVGGNEVFVIDLKDGQTVNNMLIGDGNYFVGDFFGTEEHIFTLTARGLYKSMPTDRGCLRKLPVIF